MTPSTAMTTTRLCACALCHCHPSLLRHSCLTGVTCGGTHRTFVIATFQSRILQSQARDKLVVVDFYARWYETSLSCRHLFMPLSPLPLTLHACCSSIQLCRTMQTLRSTDAPCLVLKTAGSISAGVAHARRYTLSSANLRRQIRSASC